MRYFFYVFCILIIPSCVVGKLLSAKKSPESYYELAKQKVADGYNYEAIKYLGKALKDKPDYTDAYLLRASAWMKEDSFDRAISDYSKIIELKPSGEAYYSRGNAYWMSASGRDSLACKDWLKSRDTYNFSRSWDAIRMHCKK